jgi:flagellar assembly factor FliW
VLGLFSELPGSGTRERGVYEVEQDRLYFVSLGTDCYFLLVSPVHTVPDYEAAIREVLKEQQEYPSEAERPQ